jgi:hypothetical protein
LIHYLHKKNFPKNNKLFLGINCTQGGNRTRTP